MKLYECEYYSVMAHERSCLFCAHCTDVFWDYTNGPYAFICDTDGDPSIGIGSECGWFDEETED